MQPLPLAISPTVTTPYGGKLARWRRRRKARVRIRNDVDDAGPGHGGVHVLAGGGVGTAEQTATSLRAPPSWHIDAPTCSGNVAGTGEPGHEARTRQGTDTAVGNT